MQMFSVFGHSRNQPVNQLAVVYLSLKKAFRLQIFYYSLYKYWLSLSRCVCKGEILSATETLLGVYRSFSRISNIAAK